MDLFSPVTDRLHPNFERILHPIYKAEREHLLSWADGFQDRDGKFVKEFQTTFNSAFWELYLHKAFKELGYKSDYNFSAPDFCIKRGRQQIIAEAVISEPPLDHVPEYAKPDAKDEMSPEEYYNIINNSCVRLANSITEKYKKYKNSYQGLAHVKGKPFVLCVAPFDHPSFFYQGDRSIRRVLYGMDAPLVQRTSSGLRQVGEAFSPTIEKENKSPINLGLFANDSMKEISAVIFSVTATWSKVSATSSTKEKNVKFFGAVYDSEAMDAVPFDVFKKDFWEQHLDGLYVFLNPYAETKFNLKQFIRPEVTIACLEPEIGKVLYNMPDRFLLSRRCFRFGFKKMPKNLFKVDTSKFKKVGYHKKWDEGELIPVHSIVMHFEDNHMAHYKGWTVVICRCTVGNDWGYQAVKGKAFDLTDYFTLNNAASIDDSILPDKFCKTMQDAFEACKTTIDSKLIKPKKKAKRKC